MTLVHAVIYCSRNSLRYSRKFKQHTPLFSDLHSLPIKYRIDFKFRLQHTKRLMSRTSFIQTYSAELRSSKQITLKVSSTIAVECKSSGIFKPKKKKKKKKKKKLSLITAKLGRRDGRKEEETRA